MRLVLPIIFLLTTFSAHASLGPSNTQYTSAHASATLWPLHPDWDRATLTAVRSRKADFEKGRDIDNFCPGYRSASTTQQESCLLRIISATVQKESNFNPNDYSPEDKGLASVGLMQLSRGECANAMMDAALKDPIKNLTCGINKLANLVRDGKCFSCRSGGGKYWSTLRNPYTYRTRSGRILHLGKANEIAALTRNYRNAAPSAPGSTPELVVASAQPTARTIIPPPTRRPRAPVNVVTPQPEDNNAGNAESAEPWRAFGNNLWSLN
jgi:hypothetical protein